MFTKTKNKIVALMAILTFLIGGYFVAKTNKNPAGVENKTKTIATLYKSPTCGCCVGYSQFLKKDGYEVSIEETTDMDSVKQAHNIPSNMQSCHTVLIGNYFIEGHIPLEVVDKLLAERPDLDGIALPGMPAGSPGMPGIKSEEFIIYGIKGGQVSEYTRI